MKKFIIMFGVAALLTGILMAGCGGGGGDATATGSVVKGPVNGAIVSFAGSTETSVTDASGKFVIKVPGAAITSTGGTYYDVATGTAKAAPTLSAEAGATAVTPITTVLTTLSGAAKTEFVTALAKLGVSNPLTATLDTKSPALAAAITLNELLGDAIVKNTNTVNLGTFVSSIAASVNSPSATTFSETTIATIATTAAATAGVPTTSFSAIANAVATLPNNATLPTVTTTTGGGSTTSTAAATTSTTAAATSTTAAVTSTTAAATSTTAAATTTTTAATTTTTTTTTTTAAPSSPPATPSCAAGFTYNATIGACATTVEPTGGVGTSSSSTIGGVVYWY